MVRQLKTTNSLLIAIAFLLPLSLSAQPPGSNYDESKMPAYTLPDPLMMRDGKKVVSIEQWDNIQRPWLYHLFEENVYGRFPVNNINFSYSLMGIDSNAMEGKAIRKMVTVYFNENQDPQNSISLLMYLPKNVSKPVPVFLGMNFYGNHSVTIEKDIPISGKYRIDGKGIVNHRATDSSRGSQAHQWQIEEILSHGYGLVTFFCGDAEEDNPEGWKTGIRTTLQNQLKIRPEEWSAIGAWAWALGRAMDYLEQDKSVNARKVALIGHSRLGKAALWAAACDKRFSIIISNESGEGGAALSKRWYGETVAIINEKFPHWFCSNYKKYNDNTAALPIDQHMLLSLMAPRPLYVASAMGDQWSDPKGEFLSAVNAGPVYLLFKKEGIGTNEMPPLNQPVGNTIRYHIRDGQHDVLLYDWKQYLSFADKQWGMN
jgi:hypothetical protein